MFTDEPYRGNPVAVVLGADDVDTETMQRLAQWTNLSETTFVLAPTTDRADYRVRIFTPVTELPFAGHPTLGTCHAWLQHGGEASQPDAIVQECAAGLIPIRRAERLAFAAPPLIRSGPADDAVIDELAAALQISRDDIVTAEWADNGPGWVAVQLASAEAVLAIRPAYADLNIGLVGAYPPGSPERIEVRAFFPKDGALVEDPVTGSLNASLGQWLTQTGRVSAPYVASQGKALGRAGRVYVSADDDGQIWVGGGTVSCVEGAIEL